MQRQMKEHADFARNSIHQAHQAASQAEARASAAERAVFAAREDAFSQSPIKKEDEFLDDAFDPKGNTPFTSIPGICLPNAVFSNLITLRSVYFQSRSFEYLLISLSMRKGRLKIFLNDEPDLFDDLPRLRSSFFD